MFWESSDVVGFDLGPLLEGQMWTAKLKSAYNWLIIGPIGFGALSLRWIQFASVLRCARSSLFLCQLTCQSADIMSSLCGVGVRVRVNKFSSKTTRPRDVLFFLKDTLSIEDEKLFKACKSVCSSVC